MASNQSVKETQNKILKKSNTVTKTIRFIISLVLILVIGYVILNYVPFIAKYSNHVVVTDSMVPVINVNDVVIIDNSYEIEDLNIGDIIAFNVDLNNDGVDEIVVHHLFSVEEVDDEIIIKTIAHDKNTSDPWELSPDDILGKHVLTIGKIGSFLRFASSTFGKIVLIFDIIIIYFIVELFSEDEDKKKDKKNLEQKLIDKEHIGISKEVYMDDKNRLEDE